jgi:hypothetical protein
MMPKPLLLFQENAKNEVSFSGSNLTQHNTTQQREFCITFSRVKGKE